MAGGTFDKMAAKVRPGTYINFESARQEPVGAGERGTVLLPLANHEYGPAKRFITISGSAPDASYAELGFSVFDDNPSMLLVREALKNAQTVVAYIPSQGARAEAAAGEGGAIKAKARYGGTRGNALSFSVTASPLNGFDVTVYLDAAVVSAYEGLATIEELAGQNDEWIEFTGDGGLSAVAGASLAGGAGAAFTVADITEFLDGAEAMPWNVLAFPFEPTGEAEDIVPSLQEAVKSKIKYLREGAGKYRKAVCARFAADYEGVVNVTNGVIVNGQELSAGQATAWVAGADAGAANTQSNTYATYVGATGIVGVKSHAEAVAAIDAGEFFFSFSEAGAVVVEYDINSLTTFRKPKDGSYRKNRVIRVLDTLAESLTLNFPPNRFDNNEVGWGVMEGIGRSVLKAFADAGAIQNADYDADFVVDRSLSVGDATYFNVGVEPTDSAEKLYFTIKTR